MVRLFETAEDLAGFGAGWIAARAVRSVLARGRFDLAVAGGRSPALLLRELGRIAQLSRPRWERIHLWFTDERAVPPEDPEANAATVLDALGRESNAAAARVHRIRAETSDLEAAAREYETVLPAALDLVVLGIGEDGHIASLFPDSPLLAERARRVAVVRNAPKPPPERITLTPRALDEAAEVVVLAVGAEKAAATARALRAEGPPADPPARLVRDRWWWVDRDAAAALPAPC
jgi:6-phosphogluconolactonase